MTTKIKIQFIKIEAKKIVDTDDSPANAKGLEIKTSPIFLNEFFKEVPPSSSLNKMELAFFDGVEKEIYNELLDEEKFKFELSFEKEKINFCVLKAKRRKEVDDTKIEINYLEKDGTNGILRILFKPQFAGVVKITDRDKGKNIPNNNGGGKQPSPNNTEIDKQIANLQSQIKTLEEKIKNTPNSDTKRQNYNQEIQNLKAQLKEKENEKLQRQPIKKNSFPWKETFGAGAIIIIALVVVLLIKKIIKE